MGGWISLSRSDCRASTLTVQEWLQDVRLPHNKTNPKFCFPTCFFTECAFSQPKKALLLAELGNDWFIKWNERLSIDGIQYRLQWLPNPKVATMLKALVAYHVQRSTSLDITDWNCMLQLCFDFFPEQWDRVFDRANKAFPNHNLLYAVQ